MQVSARWMTGTTRPSSMATASPTLIVGAVHDRAVLPRRVHARVPRDRRRDELDQQIRIGDVGAGLLARLIEPRGQSGHVDLAHQIEVRRGRPARGHALGHDSPDGADARSASRGALGADRRRRARRGRHVVGQDGPARPEPRSAPTSSPRSAASRRALGDAAASRAASPVDRPRSAAGSRRRPAHRPSRSGRWPSSHGRDRRRAARRSGARAARP